MDISNEDIARLVLGYLKSENCKSAEEHFLVSSRHLKVISGAAQRPKRFITHVYGYCLTEMLKEYAKLYTVIIEYLEETIYPNEFTNRDMHSKLIFLLENAKYTRSSTPNQSPIRSSSPKRTCNINGMLVHELASNNNVDSSDKKRTEKEEESNMISDNPDDKNNQELSTSQVLAETFLENKELQNKQVENINSVIQKPLDETVGCNATKNVTNSELLNSAVDINSFNNLMNNFIGGKFGPDKQNKYTKNINSHPPAKKARHSESMCMPNEGSMMENTKLSPKQVVEPADSYMETQIITMEGAKVDSTSKQNLNEQAATTIVTTENAPKSPKSTDKVPAESIQIQSDSENTNVHKVQDLSFSLVKHDQVPGIERKCNIDENVNKEVAVLKVNRPFAKVNYNQGSNSIEGNERTQTPRRKSNKRKKSYKSSSINKYDVKSYMELLKDLNVDDFVKKISNKNF